MAGVGKLVLPTRLPFVVDVDIIRPLGSVVLSANQLNSHENASLGFGHSQVYEESVASYMNKVDVLFVVVNVGQEHLLVDVTLTILWVVRVEMLR